MDAEPYESRGFYRTLGLKSHQGGESEWFNKSTWVQRDICGREPFPFRDKSIDFAVCSHTLEDIRDPLWVCSELIRVAKRGYVEVPSREWETCRGQERRNEAGLSHHRWLIEIEGQRINFLMKYHMIHSHWRFSFPRSFARQLPPERSVQWLWWHDDFDFEETTLHGVLMQERELERFVETTHPYPAWQLSLDRYSRESCSLVSRAISKLGRTFRNYSSPHRK